MTKALTDEHIPLAAPDVQEFAEATKQRDAIFRLEGFEPTEQTRRIDAAVLAGRVTDAQVTRELREYIEEHQTTDGFIETRSWA